MVKQAHFTYLHIVPKGQILLVAVALNGLKKRMLVILSSSLQQKMYILWARKKVITFIVTVNVFKVVAVAHCLKGMRSLALCKAVTIKDCVHF